MLIPWYQVRNTAREDLGVFATRRIARGTIVWIATDEILVYTRAEFDALDHQQQLCAIEHASLHPDGVRLSMDDGRLMNHSCDPNTLGNDYFNVAVRDIEAGQEICCDYRQYDEVGIGAMPCLCGSVNCQGSINHYPVDSTLSTWWDDQFHRASQAMPHVPQPLEAEIIRWKPELSPLFQGIRPRPSTGAG